MQYACTRVAEFLEGGQGLWLADGAGEAPDGCAVVATSGSSGQAKPVVLHRDALQAAAHAAQLRLGFSATWHLALAPHYVAGLMVVVRGLLGSGVCDAGADLSSLQPAPGRNCVSIVATQLYRAMEQPAVLERLTRVDAVLVGGAALDPALRARAERAGVHVIETYGMSETCGGVVWDGLPLPGADITLGERGRVHIAGPMLFEGYLGYRRPPGPFPTNDRGQWRGGRLVIEGRLDDVVISGGVNVDLAEIRRVLAAVETEAEVLAVDDPEWGARIVLFAPNGTLESWRETLRAHLAPAALPRQLVLVERLPRTSGGKPERQTLLELARS